MHLIACAHAIAGIAQYTLPVTDTSCRVTNGAVIATLLLYDVSAGSRCILPTAREVRMAVADSPTSGKTLSVNATLQSLPDSFNSRLVFAHCELKDAKPV